MSKFKSTLLPVALAIVFGGFALLTHTGNHTASAAEPQSGITIQHGWARASAGPARNGGAFMEIINNGPAADTLVAAKGDLAQRVEIHTHLMDGGVMRMRQVPGVPLPAGKTVSLKPGGFHVMMIGLHVPLAKGASFPLRLVFKSGIEKTINVSILKAGARSMSHDQMKHDGMKHEEMHFEGMKHEGMKHENMKHGGMK